MKLALLAPLLLLAACVADPHRSAGDAPTESFDPAAVEAKNTELHLDAVRDMIAKGQYYAALAHVQDLKQRGVNDPAVLLLEADCRRHMGQAATADALYRKLLGGSTAGAAYHGLGLLYVKSNLNFAIANLRRAAQLAPTDADIRNDLGRAYLDAGRYNESLPELSTAAELAPGQTQSRRNLIVLWLATGDEAAASRMAQQLGLAPADVQKLRVQAQGLKAGAIKPAVSSPNPVKSTDPKAAAKPAAG